MAKFMAIYHAPVDAMAQMAQATPEQREEGMKMWMQWKEQQGSALTDFGAPLMNGQTSSNGSDWSAHNGDLTGYSFVDAENIEEAKKMFANHPHIPWHPEAKVTIFECFRM